MSVKIESKENGSLGELSIISESKAMSAEDYVNRVNGLIRLVRNQDENMAELGDMYHVLDLLEDMTPSIAQAQRMFKETGKLNGTGGN